MSEAKPPVDEATLESDVDPIEDVLNVDPPIDEIKAKKKVLPKALKIGLGDERWRPFFGRTSIDESSRTCERAARRQNCRQS